MTTLEILVNEMAAHREWEANFKLETAKKARKIQLNKTLQEAPNRKKYYSVLLVDFFDESQVYFYNKKAAENYMQKEIESMKEFDTLQDVELFQLNLVIEFNTEAVESKFNIVNI